MSSILVALLAGVPLLGHCQTDEPVLRFGKRITIHSAVLHESRELWVYLPPDYDNSYLQPQHYPVLYLLDGDTHFHSVSGMVQILGMGINGAYVVPGMIVVAIPNTDRTRDLTPTHSDNDANGKVDYLGSSGGGANFLKFVKDELIPKIDSSFRTMPYRIFAGHSFGGISVVHALYTMPQTFQAYISIDPSLWWDNRLLLKQGVAFFERTDLTGKALYMAQASTVAVRDTVINKHFQAITDYNRLLETHNRSGIRWKFHYYPDDDHGSVAFIAEYDALRFIFQNYYPSYNAIDSPAALRKHFEAFSADTKTTFLPPEKVVNQFAGISQYKKNYADAQAYFQMNVELYPKSRSANESMAEFYLSQGDKKKALLYFEKLAALDPANASAKARVESLRKETKVKK